MQLGRFFNLHSRPHKSFIDSRSVVAKWWHARSSTSGVWQLLNPQLDPCHLLISSSITCFSQLEVPVQHMYTTHTVTVCLFTPMCNWTLLFVLVLCSATDKHVALNTRHHVIRAVQTDWVNTFPISHLWNSWAFELFCLDEIKMNHE